MTRRWVFIVLLAVAAALAPACTFDADDPDVVEAERMAPRRPVITAVDYPRTFPAGVPQVITVTWKGDIRFPARFHLGKLAEGCPFNACSQYIQQIERADTFGTTAELSVLYCPPNAPGTYEYALTIVETNRAPISPSYPVAFTCTAASGALSPADSPAASATSGATPATSNATPTGTPSRSPSATPARTSTAAPTATPVVVRNFTITIASTAGTNKVPGKTTVGWSGNPLFPVTLRGTTVSCPIDGTFGTPRFDQESNPLTFTGPFCAVDQRRVFVFDVEMVDATGARSPKARLTQTCDP